MQKFCAAISERTENYLNILKKDKSYDFRKIDKKKKKNEKKRFIIIVNLTKWVLQKFLMNACGMRDGMSGDMLASTQHNLVMILE